MTTIGLVANDQLLQVTVNPKISSGEVNTVSIHVDFSEEWNNFGKNAVFYTSYNGRDIYEIVMANDECIVPSEVMKKSGTLYIGIRGVNSEKNEVKTTSLVKLKISEGTPTGNSTEVEPTPDVYQQLLTAYANMSNKSDVLSARLDSVSATRIKEPEQVKFTEFILTEGTKSIDGEITFLSNGIYTKISGYIHCIFEERNYAGNVSIGYGHYEKVLTVPEELSLLESCGDDFSSDIQPVDYKGWAIRDNNFYINTPKISQDGEEGYFYIETDYLPLTSPYAYSDLAFEVADARVDNDGNTYESLGAIIRQSLKKESDVDKELKDIRVGADGENYRSAGEAVRSQINEVNADITSIKGDLVELQTYFINEKNIDLSSALVGFYYDGGGWYGVTENQAYKRKPIDLANYPNCKKFKFSSSVFQGVASVIISDKNNNTLYSTGLITENYKEYKDVVIDIPEDATSIKFSWLVFEGRYAKCSLINENVFYEIIDDRIEHSKANKNIIDCWGDSLTMGAGGNGTTYPNVLQNLLGENYVVNNYGVGGENALTIGGRQGGYEWYVEPFNIPSDTTPVEVKLKSLYEDRTVNPLLQGSVGVNPCTIKGVEGNLSLSGGKYYFTRLTSGDSVTVSRDEPIRTNAFNNHNHTLVIFIGQNGWGFADGSGVNNIYGYDRLADIIDNMVNHNKSKNYIVLGLHTLNKETRADMEEYFTRKFGNHYINLRKYLTTPIYKNGVITSCYGLEDANITPTEADLSNIENGVVPNSLLSDEIHFNASGYTVIGNLIYRIGKSLDYWK